MRKRLQSYTQSDIMKFIIDTDQFTNNYKALLLLPPQGFGLVTPDPFSSCELGGVWARDVNPFVASFWYSTFGSGSGYKTRHVPLEAKKMHYWSCIISVNPFFLLGVLVLYLWVWVQKYLEAKRK